MQVAGFNKHSISHPTLNRKSDTDHEWRTQLQQRLKVPLQRQEVLASSEEDVLKKKNIDRLRQAMFQSYSQYGGMKKKNETPSVFFIFCKGYLPAGEVVDLSVAYSTVYHLGLDQGSITAAVNTARSVEIRSGLVNINSFINAIQQKEKE